MRPLGDSAEESTHYELYSPVQRFICPTYTLRPRVRQLRGSLSTSDTSVLAGEPVTFQTLAICNSLAEVLNMYQSSGCTLYFIGTRLKAQLNKMSIGIRLCEEMIEKEDYQFQGRSGSELVLTLYQHYGIAYISELRGIFTFCLYESERQIFLAVRDRYGVNPLFGLF